MNHRQSYWMKFARPCVALAAAYALALQILLLSVTAASAAMTPLQSDAPIICYNGQTADDGNPQPLHSPAIFADCTLACAQGLSAAAILPSDLSPAPVSSAGNPVERGLAVAFILSQQLSPRLAQGPPQNA